MNTIVKNVVLIIAGFIAGMWLSGNFSVRPKAIVESKTNSGFLAPIEAQAAQLAQEMYAGEVQSLRSRNESLARQVNADKSALEQQRVNDRMLEEIVDTLIAHTMTSTDTIVKLRDCDSLTVAAVQIMDSGHKKDSLCDNAIGTLERQVANKDSTISMQQRAYSTLRLSFENCIIHQDLAEGQFKLLERRNKGLAVKNKVLSAGVLLLTGVITYGIIK